MNPYPQEDLDLIVKYTSDFLHNFKNKNFFITGGTGFVGCNLLKALTYINDDFGLNMSFTVLTRYEERFKNRFPHLSKKINLIEGDIRYMKTLSCDKTFEYFIHGACDNDDNSPNVLYDTIVKGTENLLNFASPISKILILSSGAVYGEQSTRFVKETQNGLIHPNCKNYFYGLYKRTAESLCYMEKYSALEIKIARLFSFVGTYLPLNKHFAIGNFIDDCLNNRNIIVKNPYAVRSYMYTADMVIWLLTILEKGKPLEPYNVGSNYDLTMKGLAEHTIDSCKSKNLIGFKRDFSIDRYVPDNSFAKYDLGLDIYTPLDDAIRKTYEWNLY